MNPLDKSWEFIKAKRIDPKKIKHTEQAKKNRATKRRLAATKEPDDAQTKLNLGPNMQESGQFPGYNPKLRAEIEARNKKARANLEEEAEGPKYPNPPTSEPSQSNLVSSTGINDPHDPRTMRPMRNFGPYLQGSNARRMP